MTDERSLLHERAILSAAIQSPSALVAAFGMVTPLDFSDQALATVFAAAVHVHGHGGMADAHGVYAEIEHRGRSDAIGGFGAVMALLEEGVDPASVEHHAVAVRHYSRMRRLARLCTRTAEAAASSSSFDGDAVIEELQGRLARDFTGDVGSDIEAFPSILKRVVLEVRERYDAKGEAPGRVVPTGWPDLDERLGGGFQPGELIIIGGRPSMGKSLLALCATIGCAKSRPGAAILYCSLEMRSSSLVRRAIAGEGGIRAENLRTGRVTDGELERMVNATRNLRESAASVYVYDRARLSVEQIVAGAQRVVATSGKPLGLVVVDHIGIMSGSRPSNRALELGDITARLFALARDYECPVVALSQLNRDCEKRTDKRPVLADLKASGNIEEDAATVLFVYRDERYNPETTDKNIMEVSVAKQREGATGIVRLHVDVDSQRVASAARPGGYRHFKGTP